MKKGPFYTIMTIDTVVCLFMLFVYLCCLFIYVVCLQIESKISARRLNDLHSHFGQVTNPSIYSKEV